MKAVAKQNALMIIVTVAATTEAQPVCVNNKMNSCNIQRYLIEQQI